MQLKIMCRFLQDKTSKHIILGSESLVLIILLAYCLFMDFFIMYGSLMVYHSSVSELNAISKAVKKATWEILYVGFGITRKRTIKEVML